MSQPAWPMDSEWTRGDWSNARDVVDRLEPREIDQALNTLREIFPPDAVDRLRLTHPIAPKQHLWLGRVELIEIGHAASLFATEADVQRLRQPEEFASAAAELRAALMLTRAGAHVSRPAHQNGVKEFEFLARFPNNTALAVEVKLPREGTLQQRNQSVESRLLFGLMEKLPIPRDSQARATIRFGSAVSDLAESAIAEHIELAAREVESALARGLFQTIHLGPLGSVTIAPDESGLGLQYDAMGVELDQTLEGRRVRRSALTKAAKQLAESSAPGLLIVDLGLNSLLRNSMPFLERWTTNQEHFAATVLLDRQFFGYRMYTSVDPLPGPLFAAVEPLFEAWDLCSSNHLHYCSLCNVAEPCPCGKWFTTYDVRSSDDG